MHPPDRQGTRREEGLVNGSPDESPWTMDANAMPCSLSAVTDVGRHGIQCGATSKRNDRSALSVPSNLLLILPFPAALF